MKNKNNVFLILLAIATLLTAVIGATYAYFASVTDGTGVSTDLDVEAQANTAQFTAEGGTFGFTVTGADMMQANAGSLAKESTGSLEVNLTSPKLALCTFDVKFAWNEGSSYTPTATLADGVTEFGVLYEGNSYGAVNNAAKVINFDKLLNNYDGIVLDQAKIAILESDGTEKTETINLNFKVQMYNLNHDQSALAGTTSKTYNGKFYIDNVECTETKLPLNDVILASNEIYPDNIASPYVTNETGIDFGQVSSDTNGKGIYYTNENTENNDYTFYFRGDVDNNNVSLPVAACIYNGSEVKNSSVLTENQCVSNNVCKVVVELDYSDPSGNATEISEYYGGLTSDECSAKIGYDAGYLISEKPTYGQVDILWRIVRVNEDGSIRLIRNTNVPLDSWADNETTNSETRTVTVNYETFSYMHGALGSASELINSVDSNIKILNDEYYLSSLSNYSNILSDAGFCNDRSYDSGTPFSGDDRVYFNATRRQKPQFKCNNAADLFTMGSSNKGNRLLSYPIGLITADEVKYAGNATSYLVSDVGYWTMTPYSVEYMGSYSTSSFYMANGLDYVHLYGSTNGDYGLRPVINLSSNVKISSGDGTESNPYQLILE